MSNTNSFKKVSKTKQLIKIHTIQFWFKMIILFKIQQIKGKL